MRAFNILKNYVYPVAIFKLLEFALFVIAAVVLNAAYPNPPELPLGLIRVLARGIFVAVIFEVAMWYLVISIMLLAVSVVFFGRRLISAAIPTIFFAIYCGYIVSTLRFYQFRQWPIWAVACCGVFALHYCTAREITKKRELAVRP